MARRGPKPRELGHIQRLEGSQHAKTRMETLLLTLSGGCTIEEAQQRLQLSESQLHAIRQQWLQEAIALLEPRPRGRPAQQQIADLQQLAELQRENRSLRRELALARAAHEVQEVLATLSPLQKGATPS